MDEGQRALTVTTTLSRVSYIEDGVTTVFPVPFRFLADADLVVERVAGGVATPLSLSADYTVSGADYPTGGSITRLVATNGATLRIRRETPREQQMAYVVGDDFPAESHERALDRQMLISQEADAAQGETDARALRVPTGVTAPPVPDPALNLGTVLGVGAAGALLFLTMGGADAALRTDLASAIGSALVGFSYSDPGLPGSVADRLAQDACITDPPFSANRNGAADCTAALVAANATGKQMVVPNGTYLVSSSVTLTDVFMNGGILKPANGVTITIKGAFRSLYRKCFDTSLGGIIVFDPVSPTIALSEWWGAIVNDSSTGAMNANLASVGAAVAACARVDFVAGDYFFNQTLKINTPHRTLRGISKHWSSGGQSTRLVQMSATADAVQIGPDTKPVGGPNFFLQEVHISDLSIVRGPTLTGNATYKNCPAGIRMQYTLYCSAENIWSTEHSIGVIFSGCVQTRVKEIFSFRSLAGTDPAHDPFFGFFYDGSAAIGLAGGNASVYEVDCNTTVGGSPALTISAHSYGQLGYTDWFIERPESAGTQYGMVLDGTGASGTGTQDIKVADAVFDQCLISGIKMMGGGAQTIVNITNPYAALNTGSTTAVAAIDIENVAGLVDIDGGQILGGLATTGDVGIKINGSSGVNIRGTLIRECRAPVQISGASNCYVAPRINNPTVGTSGAGAIDMSGTNVRIIVAPQIIGGAGVFGPGIRIVGTTSTSCTFDVSGIDPASCASGIKLSNNGTSITVAGAFAGTCLAQGNFN